MKARKNSTVADTKGPTLTKDVHKSEPITTGRPAHKDALKSTKQSHLFKDVCPINTVSNEGFRKIVNILDKRYVVPWCNFFFSKIVKLVM